MKIKEIYEKLIKTKGMNISKTEFGKSIGVSRQYVGQMLNENKEFSEERIKEIEKYFEVDLTSESKESDNLTDALHQEFKEKLGLSPEESDILITSIMDLSSKTFIAAMNGDPEAQAELIGYLKAKKRK
jgi:transcriptional regulator with XRE-family HTH domain